MRQDDTASQSIFMFATDVNRPVEFNGQACLKADKIDNKAVNRKLAPEFNAAQPSVT